MGNDDIGPVIAERRLLLDGEPTVVVRVGLPFTADRLPWESWCPYRINGLGSDRIRRVVGIDPVQSLCLALELIGATHSARKSTNPPG